MAESLQRNSEERSPFSPLQTGCAFVMLTNMLIYLGVVLFTFNLLDPSNLDASYLAKRGFTARPDPKSEQDAAYQKIVRNKREQQQIQDDLLNISRIGIKRDPSPAIRLSKIEQRKSLKSRPEEPEKPSAALTGSRLLISKPIHSRLFSASIYPHNTILTYSPINIYTPKPLILENYETLPVELAFGIRFPEFRPPSFDQPGPYLYTPPNPTPESSRGGLKLSSPSVGAGSLHTNGIQKTKTANFQQTEEKPSEKDRP